jgi:hypothetical protein
MKHLGIYTVALLLAACGNPGGISDSDYAKYKELGAPKILYSCHKGETLGFDLNAVVECFKLKDDPAKLACAENAKREKQPIIDVGYAAGVGVAVTYNELFNDAKAGCDGEFKVLDSKS